METVLRGLSYEACLVYLDDIVIVGKEFNDHLINIRKVLTKLRYAGLKLSLSKCHFFRREVKYLGHIVSSAECKQIRIKLKLSKTGLVRRMFMNFEVFWGSRLTTVGLSKVFQ
ncbi:hypothetical protein JTE90_003012 [Oedothorax gibbosus]|uniref:Reverse transcriptase domain-containing protein n=1 Tax=Oedothorax gibbosus TaxID=931172 RepID=A0AAV6VDE3_9ARAC|nr:hypothetical protein JTE90_003012 [Oedothorax gibbosus]